VLAYAPKAQAGVRWARLCHRMVAVVTVVFVFSCIRPWSGEICDGELAVAIDAGAQRIELALRVVDNAPENQDVHFALRSRELDHIAYDERRREILGFGVRWGGEEHGARYVVRLPWAVLGLVAVLLFAFSRWMRSRAHTADPPA
jgi:hypothetical protein